MVGEPNESTIAMVRPRPWMPRSHSGLRLYAFSYWTGE